MRSDVGLVIVVITVIVVISLVDILKCRKKNAAGVEPRAIDVDSFFKKIYFYLHFVLLAPTDSIASLKKKKNHVKFDYFTAFAMRSESISC